MYQTNQNKTLRSALLLGAASAAALSLSAPAFAQDDTSVETVVVTGSRIPQTGLYSISPVTAVGAQEIKESGTTNVVDILNSLPSVFVGQSGTFDNGATGTATVDLRGLGSARTLVLVNGSRLMPGDPLAPVADVDVVPANLVDHIEVLTGGASAVYGSDAVAGVVNFILKKDFEGVEVDGQLSAYQHNNSSHYVEGLFTDADFPTPSGGVQKADTGSVVDGQNQNVSLTMGVNSPNGKGNVTVFLGYQNQEPVSQSARDFSQCQLKAISHNTTRECAGSQTYGYVESLDNYLGPNGGPGSAASAGYFTTGTGTKQGGAFVPFTGAPNQYFNFAHYQLLLRQDTRYNAGFEAHYEVNKQFEIYSDMLFMDDKTTSQIGPSGIFFGTGPISGAYSVNCTNPYLSQTQNQALCGEVNPEEIAGVPVPDGTTPGEDHLITSANPNPQLAAIAVALGHSYYDGLGNGVIIPPGATAPTGTPGSAAIFLARRNVEGGPRTYNLEHESYRFKVGARGDLGDGWTYDAYAQLGYTSFTDNDGGQLLLSNVINSLQVDPITGQCISGGACVPYDVFGGFGAPSSAALNYVQSPSLTQGWTKELVVSGALTGDLGEWGIKSPWAKNAVGVSVGSEYRQEQIFYLPDLANQQGLLVGGSATPPLHGGYNVAEAFTEVTVPLIQNVPFFEDLEINGGYRYSSYNISGSTSTYKYGAEWQPIDDFKVRGSFERAVRAPNINELFTPATLGLFSAKDPCAAQSAPSPTVITNCQNAPGAAAVPNAGSGQINCPASQCVAYVGGNLSLKPEIADTRSLGIVLTPTFLDGFSATVDYFDIRVSNPVSAIPESTILNECYGEEATTASQGVFCPYVHRTAGTHSIAINTTSTATSGYVASNNTNTGSLTTKGFDFEAHYHADLGDWDIKDAGSLSFSFLGTLLNSLKSEPISGLGTYDCAGLYGNTCGDTSRWRHKARVTWETPWDVSLSAQWRHQSGVSLDSNSNQALLHNGSNPIDAKLDAADYIDLTGTWDIRQNIELTAGVNNVFDKDPPLTTVDSSATNTYPGNYDVLGRYLFVNGSVKF